MPGLTAAGIIAAGEGSRLRESHPGVVKPLVPLAGAPLCHWIVQALQGAGITEFALLHNSRGRAIQASLREGFPSARWTFLEADTASSWESFRLLAQTMSETAPAFLMSTVDCLMWPAQARRFAQAMAASNAQAGLALTDFVDDEKPLWAELGASGCVTALGDSCRDKRLATAGLYFVTRDTARAMAGAGAFQSLRGYLAALVAAGGRVDGLVLEKTLDIDRPQDLAQAEKFLKDGGFSC